MGAGKWEEMKKAASTWIDSHKPKERKMDDPKDTKSTYEKVNTRSQSLDEKIKAEGG